VDRFDCLIRTLTRIDGLTGEARERRRLGLDWPADGAETMIGVERLTNVKDLALDVSARGIPGDFMECGIWRGGVGILLAQIVREENEGRRVWLADSFDGCPIPDEQFPADQRDPHHTFEFLKVSLEQVMQNLQTYGINPWGHDVQLLPGWFKETLPGPVGQLALLRIDADMYESTTQVLDSLYDHVSLGGYVICDDYHNIPNCHAAIEDFRRKHGITAPIQSVDWCAVYWRKEAAERQAAA
jgi:O-methyltransferase